MLNGVARTEAVVPRASTSSSHASGSFDLPSLQPLSHDHPLLAAETFDADAFLLTRGHIPLEELRGELREYLAQLREELVQLINDDYEEFISLGTGLRGEGDRLQQLRHPLVEVNEEVQRVRQELLAQQSLVQAKLDERSGLREEKALLDLLQRLFETLPRAEALLEVADEDRSKVINRVAGEYTQLAYLLQKAQSEGCQILAVVTARMEGLRKKISSELSKLLVDAALRRSTSQLLQCLRTYELIDGWKDAETVVRNHVQTSCKDIINVASLAPSSPLVPQTPHSTSNPFEFRHLKDGSDLGSILNRTLAFVESLRPLMSAASGFNFDVFSMIVWPEVSAALANNLGNTIFAAGRPDELHKHYTLIHDFVSVLESMAPTISSVESMRDSAAHASFERRWQLPVYYQLRWKEIVGAYEIKLASSTQVAPFLLPQSSATWEALSSCWNPEIYITELAPRFWRLSLQILSRYSSWLKKAVEQAPMNDEDSSLDDAVLLLATSGVSDRITMSRYLVDLNLPGGLKLDVTPIPEVESRIISIITKRCVEPLKHVRSVASQLRSTPEKWTHKVASFFIPTILKPLRTVIKSQPGLNDRYSTVWSTQIFDSVCSNYSAILASVRKTEDLLRRHRKSKKSTFSLFGSSNAPAELDGEDESFQRQMALDVATLATDAQALGVDVESLNSYKELLDVISRPAE